MCLPLIIKASLMTGVRYMQNKYNVKLYWNHRIYDALFKVRVIFLQLIDKVEQSTYQVRQ